MFAQHAIAVMVASSTMLLGAGEVFGKRRIVFGRIE